MQGNVVARAVIEFCDGGPPVSLHSVTSSYLVEITPTRVAAAAH